MNAADLILMHMCTAIGGLFLVLAITINLNEEDIPLLLIMLLIGGGFSSLSLFLFDVYWPYCAVFIFTDGITSITLIGVDKLRIRPIFRNFLLPLNIGLVILSIYLHTIIL